MDTSDFVFALPPEQIAQRPSPQREDARLMMLNARQQVWRHHRVADLPELLPSDCLLVLNNSRVRPCRIWAESEDSGSLVELLLLRPVVPDGWLVQSQRARRQRVGRRYRLPGGVVGEVVAERAEGQRILRFTPTIDDLWLERYGRMPLPPYVVRKMGDDDQESFDRERYQPVYAQHHGSAAAPTAGLHFSRALLATLRERGVETVFVTLHVGLGTFVPIRSKQVEDHVMHTERYVLGEKQAGALNRAKAEGRTIIAVGTTSLRLLESCWNGEEFVVGEGETDKYIYPGYPFSAVRELITNFHTPRSSLLVLVSALAGWPLIQAAYQEAVAKGYRFFSYGDAMWIRSTV